MALKPKDTYPSQTDTTDPNYPQGKARNVVVSGDGTGTPLEKAWVNDLWGFLQALLAGASIVATGTPDHVGASQYLDALKALFLRAPASSTDNAIVRFDGTTGKLTQNSDVTIADDGSITTPGAVTAAGVAAGQVIVGAGGIQVQSGADVEIVNGDVTFGGTGEPSYSPARSVSKRIHISHAMPLSSNAGASQWYLPNSNQWFSRVNAGTILIDLRKHLPRGAVVTEIDVYVDPGTARATSGNRIQVGVQVDAGLFAVKTDDGTAAGQDVLLSTAAGWSPIPITATTRIYVYIVAGNDGATNQDIFSDLIVTFNDPGPRSN